MMCHRIGRPPISIMGFGLMEVSSDILVPSPPARMTAFTDRIRSFVKKRACAAKHLLRPGQSTGAPRRHQDKSPDEVNFRELPKGYDNIIAARPALGRGYDFLLDQG